MRVRSSFLIAALVLFAGLGCARQVRPAPPDPVVAGVIPGCPATEEGQASPCTWRRALWAAEVWKDGGLDYLIPSGAAVHNRWVESRTTRAVLIELGVPADRIVTETQALHTDENIAYSLPIAEAIGAHRLVGISERGQAVGICKMATMWGWGCAPAPMDMARIRDRLAETPPPITTEPVPEDEWQHWTDRERALRRARGEPPRLRSPARYFALFMTGTFGGTVEPPVPPAAEPSLATFEAAQARR